MTLEDRLITYYQDEQSRHAPPGNGVNAAIARGRRRRRRLRVAETSVVPPTVDVITTVHVAVAAPPV